MQSVHGPGAAHGSPLAPAVLRRDRRRALRSIPQHCTRQGRVHEMLAPHARMHGQWAGHHRTFVVVMLTRSTTYVATIASSRYAASANTFPPNATAKVGLLWGNSRPSDDRDYYNYNIPQNMLAVVALGKAAEIASRVYGDSVLAAAAVGLGDSVDEAIQQYGVFPGNASVPRM